MHYARSLVAAFAWTLLSAAELTSQQLPDTVQLGEVVVTATRLPAARHAVPAAVTVVGGDELRARGAHRLIDALRTVVGAHLVSSGATGSITSLFLRGGEADYVLVLVDGVQVNEPGGAYDFGQLSMHNVERIEVVRGPVSVLYGTDAVAGVVQVFTKQGVAAPRVYATLEGGSFGKRGVTLAGDPATGRGESLHLDAGIGGGTRALRYSAGVSRASTDGILAVNNDYENTSGSARLRLSRPWTGASARGTRSDAALTLRLTDHTYHYPTDGAGRMVDLNQHSSGLSTAFGLEVGHFFSERFEARATATLHRRTFEIEDTSDTPADTLGFYASTSEDRTRRSKVDARANVHFTRGTLTLGAAAEWQKGSSDLFSMSQFGPFESASDNARENRAGYAQLVTNPLERLVVTVGGRLEDSERFGGFATYRLGANLNVTDGLTLRAALGTAFKEPTFYENFAEGFVRGNPDLDPERSRAREVGASGTIGAGSITLTLFDQTFTDMIQYDPRPVGQRPGEANYFNLAEARSRGVEAELQLRPMQRLDVRAGWVYLDTEVLDAGAGADRAFIAGDPLLRRPAHSGNVNATVRVRPSLRATATSTFVGKRDDLDFAADWQGQRVMLEAHATADLGIELDFANVGWLGPMSLTARVKNAFDESYQEIRGYPAAGRALYVGIRTAG